MLEPLCSRSEIIEEAETFAAAVCMAKNGATKIEITQYIKTIYYMPDDGQKYLPDEQGSGFVPALPYALQVFLSSDSFSETLYNTAYTEIHEILGLVVYLLLVFLFQYILRAFRKRFPIIQMRKKR